MINGEARPAVEIIQLEKQNERLKEALVRYYYILNDKLIYSIIVNWQFI